MTAISYQPRVDNVASSDEIMRCQELAKYKITFDSPEADFDNIAKLATEITQSPIGGMSLVDDQHVWLKARVGVDLQCLQREGAFCASAVDSNCDFFVVENAKEDTRFANNPLVTDAGIRFYAAATIFNKGYCLGTLWIMDKRPRKLEEKDILLLQGLASQVVRLLDKRYHNPLSGFSNISAFKKDLQTALNSVLEKDQLTPTESHDEKTPSEDSAKNKCAIGFVKIHELHMINRLYGRSTADNLIRTFASYMNEWVSQNDFCT